MDSSATHCGGVARSTDWKREVAHEDCASVRRLQAALLRDRCGRRPANATRAAVVMVACRVSAITASIAGAAADVSLSSKWEDLPQVQCPGSKLGLCVCDWADSDSCSVVSNDNSQCWACCCQAMHPQSFEHAKQQPAQPFPQQATVPPRSEHHAGPLEDFLADDLVNIRGQCATVVGYNGRNEYVVTLISTGEMRAFLSEHIVVDPDCKPSTSTGGMQRLQSPWWARLAMAVLLAVLMLCCCCYVFFAFVRRRWDSIEEDHAGSEDTEDFFLREAAYVPDTAEEWPIASGIYNNTLGLFFASPTAEVREAHIQEADSSDWPVAAFIYDRTFGLLFSDPAEARAAVMEAPDAACEAEVGQTRSDVPLSSRTCTPTESLFC